jgi:hypothetical protein
MPSDKKRDYEVGYGRPPRHARFELGRSGNPRGRPSRSKNLSTLLSEALSEPVVVVENGRRRTIDKRRAIVTQIVNRSAKGELKAIQTLLPMLRDIEDVLTTGRRIQRLSPRPTSRSSNGLRRGSGARASDKEPFARRIRCDPAIGPRLFN